MTSGAKLVLVGMVVGTLTVEPGGYANIIGRSGLSPEWPRVKPRLQPP